MLWMLSCSCSTVLTHTANSMQRKYWADPRRSLFWGPETSTDLGWETQQPWRQKLFCVSSPKQHILAILHQQRAQMLQVHTAPTQRQRHLQATSGVTQGHTCCALSLHLINHVRNAHTAPVRENTESRAVSWGGRCFCLEGSKSKAMGNVHLSRSRGKSGKDLGKIDEWWWREKFWKDVGGKILH